MKPEAVEQAAGIRLLQSLGGEVYVSGTKRPRPNPDCPTCRRNQSTRQTPGIADVHAFMPIRGSGRRRLLMWEVKAPGGRPSEPQKRYSQLCAEADVWNVTGTSIDLESFLRVVGLLPAGPGLRRSEWENVVR